MALFWGWKQRGLYKYIMLEAGNEKVWHERSMYTTCHVSGVEIWTGNGFWFVDIYESHLSPSKQQVGFSLMQKWRIYRKLKKMKQKIEKQKRAEEYKQLARGFDSKEDMYLAKMVEGTLTGEKAR
ncbi:hypothetical protein D3C87_905850 [compost metagenome]